MALQCCVALLVENNMNMDEVIVEAENETGEPSDITDIGTETVEEGNLNVNPWPRLEELFTFSSQSSDKKNLLFKCKLCPPSKKPFSTYKTSHSNLRKHIKVRDKNGQQIFFNLSSHFVIFLYIS
jgi:hypothetical protein